MGSATETGTAFAVKKKNVAGMPKLCEAAQAHAADSVVVCEHSHPAAPGRKEDPSTSGQENGVWHFALTN